MQYSQGFFLCPGGQLVQQLPVHLWTFLFFKSRGIAGDVIPCFFLLEVGLSHQEIVRVLPVCKQGMA